MQNLIGSTKFYEANISLLVVFKPEHNFQFIIYTLVGNSSIRKLLNYNAIAINNNKQLFPLFLDSQLGFVLLIDKYECKEKGNKESFWDDTWMHKCQNLNFCA